MIDVRAKIQQARQYFESGKQEQARAFLARALQQNPSHPDLCNATSLGLLAMGQLDLAVYNAERAVEGRPKDPGFLTNLGNALAQVGKHAKALDAYRRVLAVQPESIAALLGTSHMLRMGHRFTEALEPLYVAQRLAPNDTEMVSSIAFLLVKMGRADEAAAIAEQGLSLHPGDHGCTAALAHALNYAASGTGPRVLQAHMAFGQRVIETYPRRWSAYPNRPDPERRLRIGLLSHDFYRHPIAYFIEPLLRHHDRQSVEIICYFTGPYGDEITSRLKPLADGWKHLPVTHYTAIADQIYKDGVDVLVELAGLAANHNMPVMAMQPAPVQVDYLGYPCTTGLATIGHRIVDGVTDPAGHEAYSSERLTRIDPAFLCYQAAFDAPEVGSRTRSELNGAWTITFGSFNSLPKINQPVIAAWARILKSVPGSGLILKALEYEDPLLTKDVHSRFEKEGISADRVKMFGLKAGFVDHLELYRHVDIALDPFPYNGTTTTCEALWMGVPVVTVTGDRHVARVSTMILQNLGLSELIAPDIESYIKIAASLASDAPRIAEYRQTLRGRMAGSPLCDGPAYARRMQSALRDMWRAWCSVPR